MDIMKVIMHGVKAFVFVLLASILAVIIGALTTAMGHQPEGILDQTVWMYVVLPALTALIAALENWRKHRTK